MKNFDKKEPKDIVKDTQSQSTLTNTSRGHDMKHQNLQNEKNTIKAKHQNFNNHADNDERRPKETEEDEEEYSQDNDQETQQAKMKKKKKRKKRKTKQANNQAQAVPNMIKLNVNQEDLYADSDQSEDEGIADYKIGGYHPVHVGEIMISRYVVVQKIGWGHFSTVWLARDLKYNTYVALKVQKSAQHYSEAAYDEVEILDVIAKNTENIEWLKSIDQYLEDESDYIKQHAISEHCHNVQLLNSFMYNGPNGKHFIMVFEILGVNLLEIMKRYDYKGIPIPLVRRIAKQVLMGLDYLHRICRIIHTDLKPENVILGLTIEELSEIMNKGQLSTINKNIKTHDVVKNNFFLPSQVNQPTILSNVDTTGMTKQQKKKLKKKIKKQQQNQEDPFEIAQQQPLQTEESEQINHEFPKELDQSIEFPKSHSLPNLLFNQDFEDYQFEIIRDFKAEIKNYIIQRKEKEKLKYKKEIQVEGNSSNWHERGPLIDENVVVKICDLGNGCWNHFHFTQRIQTRQYRGPEVMLGIDYDTTADLWSCACMIFELITGDFLFDPRKGPNYSKTDDHIAQMMELLGPIPKSFAIAGKHFDNFFEQEEGSNKYTFKRIKGLRHFPLKKLLTDKYRLKLEEAEQLADFLLQMLHWYPSDRATAQELLSHPWLKMKDDYQFKMSDIEYKKFTLKQNIEGVKEQAFNQTSNHKYTLEAQFNLGAQDINVGELIESDSEINGGDREDNVSLDSDDDSVSSISLSGDKHQGDQDEEFNLNVSFSGGYMPNTDLSRVDKGQGNPQFQGFDIKV